MSTNPDPVFDTAAFPYGDVLSGDCSTGSFGRPEATGGSASSELGLIVEAIAELQERLAHAREQMNQVAVEETTEYEIGRLFVEAQRLSEATLSRLQFQIQGILMEAETKAAEILREANEEATDILRQAHHLSLMPDSATQDLESAIVTFANVNSELVKDLTVLSDVLTASSGTGSHSVTNPTDDSTAPDNTTD
jgi:hypothetical protein